MDYRSQQGEQRRDPEQPVNLWSPADSGGTSARTAASTPARCGAWCKPWASRHHGLLGAAGLGLVATLGGVLARTRR